MDIYSNGRLLDALTWREQDILSLLAERHTDREIAQTLGLELNTVKWYNREIYDKLRVGNRREAAARAEEMGLLDVGQGNAAQADIGHNLPAQITSFVGRESAISDVVQLIQTTRLVTLTGPGGMGKTRLGVQAASQMVDHFTHGVWYVELAALADAQGVAPAIVGALGLQGDPARSAAETLQRFLHSRTLLLFLDNFEHVMEAAPLVAELLSASPGLTALVSSRELLRLYGEREFAVPPLAEDEAVQLFTQRARVSRPDLTFDTGDNHLVAEICARLDGLPLAIELAAARTRLMPLQAVRDQLSDRFALLKGGPRDAHVRQQTLRATIDWSYDLLDADERALLARLSVFQGGRTVEAVTEVCMDGLRFNAADGLEALIVKALLGWEEGPQGAPRFVMLETIHAYAREKLDERGETESLQRRHAEYYMGLVESVEHFLSGGRHQLRWLARLKAEYENIRTALDWALSGGDVELGQRLAGALFWFWFRMGLPREWSRWVRRALEESEGTPPAIRARLLVALGALAHALAQEGTGKEPLREAVEIYRQQGGKLRLAEALVFLSGASIGQTDEYEEAMSLCDEGLTLYRELGDGVGMAHALNVRGELERALGHLEQAKVAYEECLQIARDADDKLRQRLILSNLGFIAYHDGDYRQAATLHKDSLRLAVAMNNDSQVACTLSGFAGTVGALGQRELAVRLLSATDASYQDLGLVHQAADQVEIDLYEARLREQLDAPAFEAAWAAGRAMSLEEAVAYALDEEYSSNP